MTYVITGASGNLGMATADEVLKKVDPSEVVLVTRSPEKLAGYRERGVEVRSGDFDDPESLASAFAGGDRLLLISTDALGSRIEQHGNAIKAAKEAGIGFIAYTSLLNPVEDNPVGLAPEHRETERLIEESGIDHSFLRNALYAHMEAPSAQGAIASGQFFTNRGEGRTTFVSREDCARAAAAVLTSEAPVEKVYDITGPELLSAADEAAIFAELGGREVEAVLIDDEAAIKGMVEHGVPPEAAPVYASFGTSIREGYLDQLSTSVEQLTGQKPEGLKEILSAHLAATPA